LKLTTREIADGLIDDIIDFEGTSHISLELWV
jgi:hypothetical protein